MHRRSASSGIENLSVFSLAIDPANSSNVYAATQGGGVFRSIDGGTTWQPFYDGLDDLNVLSLAFDATNPNILYAGTETGGVYSTRVSAQSARVRRRLLRNGS